MCERRHRQQGRVDVPSANTQTQQAASQGEQCFVTQPVPTSNTFHPEGRTALSSMSEASFVLPLELLTACPAPTGALHSDEVVGHSDILSQYSWYRRTAVFSCDFMCS